MRKFIEASKKLPSVPDNALGDCNRGKLWRRNRDSQTVMLNLRGGAKATDTVVFPTPDTTGPGTKFFIEPIQSVLRGGRVDGTQWDLDNRGDDSVAFGLNVTASGANSMALGTGSTASEAGTLVWSDATTPQTSTAADEVTFGAGGGFRVYGSEETALPAYVGGQIYLDAAETVMTGKLTVTGLIDPTGLVVDGQSAVPGGTPSTGYGVYWSSDDATSVPYFTNDVGDTLTLGVATYTFGAFQSAPNLTFSTLAAPNGALTNSFVYGSQSMDDTGNAADDARFLFDDGAAAFRAGVVTGSQWDTRGDYSVAFGSETVASATLSFAAGSGSSATGVGSVALGLGSTASNANSLVFSATAAQASTSDDEVTVGCEGGIRVVTDGGGVPAYVAPQIYLDSTTTVATGTVTTSLVNAGGLALSPSVATSPAATNVIWSKNTVPTLPMYTDDAGNDSTLAPVFTCGATAPNQYVSPNPSLPDYEPATSFVFGSQSMNDSGNPDEDARFFYDAPNHAFRSGITDSTQWDDRGYASAAIGINCTASGAYSGAFGNGSSAVHDYSFVWSDATPRTSQGDSTATIGAAGGLTMTWGAYMEGFGLVQDVAASVPGGSPAVGTGAWWAFDGGDEYYPVFNNDVNEHILGRNAFINDSSGVTFNSPSARGHTVGHSFVFGSQSLDDSGAAGDVRLLLDGAAFRAGSADADQWDLANRGTGSVALGTNGTAFGTGSMALGNGSTCAHDYALVWSDATPRTSTVANQVTLGATGGASILTNAAGSLGVAVGAGLSAWAAVSDRNTKENLREVEDVLDRLETMPIYEYNYKGQKSDATYRGPMAQDWHQLFPTAKDPLRLDTMDVDGVTLAAIRELGHMVEALEMKLGLT